MQTNLPGESLSRDPIRRELLFLGCALAVAYYFDIVPISILASMLAGKAALSAELHHHLASSQLAFSCCAIGCSVFSQWICRLAGALSRPSASKYCWVIAAAGLLATLVQFCLFENIPHVSDATSHAFQAQILAKGHLAAPLPGCYEVFFQHNVVMNPNGYWHTKYFPGQALWLAPGYAVGLGWLMMPLGWAVATWALIAIVRPLHGDRMALLCGALFALSPMGLLLAGSYMSHTTFLMFALLAGERFLAAFRQNSKQRATWSLVGLFGSLALITRPQDMVAWLGPILFILLCLPKLFLTRALRYLPWLVAGAIPALAALLLWNHTLYGNWLGGGYNFNKSPSLMPIIRDSMGFTKSHTPAVALHITLQTLWRFNQALFGWPLSFAFVPFAFLADQKRWTVAALLSILAIVIVYALFPYQGFEYEARYYAPTLPFLAYLSARGILALANIERLRKGLITLLAAFAAHGVCFYIPAYLWPKYSKDYEQVSRVLEDTARAAELRHALVLVPSDYPNDFRYSSGFVLNDPWLRNRVIYARDIAAAIPCLQKSFPDRALYRFVPSADWKGGHFEPVIASAP